MNKKWMLPLLALLLILVLAAAKWGYQNLSATYQPEAPESVPADENTAYAADFTVLDGEGNPVNLSDKLGKPVVVNFWATWCPPCRAELPAFDSACRSYQDEIEFMMVDLADGSRETVDGAKAFVQENQYSFPVYYDTEYNAAMTYQVYSIPMTLFIRADGVLAYTHIGAMDAETLEAYLETLLS